MDGPWRVNVSSPAAVPAPPSVAVSTTQPSSNSSDADVFTYNNLPSYMQAIMIVMYSSVWLLAIGGNTIVCYIVLAYQRMRTITNYFIVNLALGDILMAILCIPFDFVASQLLAYWPFGAVLCPVMSYAQAVSVFVSSYTLVSISVDRYIAIIYPLRPRMTPCQAKVAIAVIWIISLSIPMPIAIVSRTVLAHFTDGTMRDRCQEVWGGREQSRSRYSMALMSLQYFLPLAVLTFTYSVITHELWGKRVPGEAEDTRDQRMERSKRKVVFKGSLKIVYISGVNKVRACGCPARAVCSHLY